VWSQKLGHQSIDLFDRIHHVTKSSSRKTPNFDTEKAHASIRSGLGMGILMLFLGIILVIQLSKGIKNINRETIFFGIILIPIMLAQGGMGIKLIVDGMSVLVKKRNWMKGTASAQAEIVDREAVITYSSNYESEDHYYGLTLKTAHIQATADSGGQIIKASVSKRIYDKYAHRKYARIFYCIADPFMFLVQGE